MRVMNYHLVYSLIFLYKYCYIQVVNYHGSKKKWLFVMLLCTNGAKESSEELS